MWEAAARLAHAGRVHGHRAEIGIVKAARALAAFLGRDTVDRETLAEGARYVLQHRLPADPLASAVDVDRSVDGLIGEHLYGQRTEDVEHESDDSFDLYDPENMQVPGAAAAGSLLLDFQKKNG
jgi:magnesium chelatase subunit D/magnesium chelatase subunit I